MTKLLLTAGIGIAAVFALSAASFAGGGASNVAPGKNKETAIGLAASDPDVGSPTPSGSVTNLGGAISGAFYGNTSNSGNNTADAPARGHGVTPSQSPGPQINGGGGPGTGTSLGEFMQSIR